MKKLLYIKNFQVERIVVDMEKKGKKENLMEKVENEGQECLEKGGQKIKVNAMVKILFVQKDLALY